MKNTILIDQKKEGNVSSLDSKSQTVLDEFVASCLTLDFERVKNLFKANPEYFKLNPLMIEAGIEDQPLLDRIEEIFNEFKENNPAVTVKDRDCTGCHGGNTKLFTVSYNGVKTSQFGFLIKQEGNSITEIRECSQYKSYQDKLSKRMYAGKTEAEIKQMKADGEGLPDLWKK